MYLGQEILWTETLLCGKILWGKIFRPCNKSDPWLGFKSLVIPDTLLLSSEPFPLSPDPSHILRFEPWAHIPCYHPESAVFFDTPVWHFITLFLVCSAGTIGHCRAKIWKKLVGVTGGTSITMWNCLITFCILTFVVRVLSICFFERDLRESLILLPKNYPVWIPKKQISSKTPRTGALLTFVPASPGQGLREGCTLACVQSKSVNSIL